MTGGMIAPEQRTRIAEVLDAAVGSVDDLPRPLTAVIDDALATAAIYVRGGPVERTPEREAALSRFAEAFGGDASGSAAMTNPAAVIEVLVWLASTYEADEPVVTAIESAAEHLDAISIKDATTGAPIRFATWLDEIGPKGGA